MTDLEGSRRAATARHVLERNWVHDFGYTAPNDHVYPWLWLWDSCFHAVIWARLGDERAVVELGATLAAQDERGFVPHMSYVLDPGHAADFWGRPGASCITQPPMYGHAVAELQRRGFDVPDELVDRARRGVGFLLHGRARDPAGLVPIVHPWESGCDNSPRWDDACPGGFDGHRWWKRKGELVRTIELDPASGSPVANPDFAVGAVGFNALVAFNAAELGLAADDLVDAIDARWDADRATWVDAGAFAGGSGRVRTLDALLPLLVAPRSRAAASLVDPTAHGGACGPAGVHREEPSFAPRTYWRGPAWPQLSYLLAVALDRAGFGPERDAVVRATIAGTDASGFAEYWDPDDGAGLGAVPQSWAGLVTCLPGEGSGQDGDTTV